MEEKIIFQPDARIHQTPSSIGLAFDDVYFTADDGVRLNGWFVPRAGATSTFLWFHGNAGNISHRVENIKLLHDKVNVNIFIFDYRGYGRSEGTASEEGTYRDGAAAIELLRKRYGVDPGKLIIFGRSLGAAVAAFCDGGRAFALNARFGDVTTIRNWSSGARRICRRSRHSRSTTPIRRWTFRTGRSG